MKDILSEIIKHKRIEVEMQKQMRYNLVNSK